MTYDYEKTYTLRSAPSDLRYCVSPDGSSFMQGSIQDIADLAQSQVGPMKGTVFVPVTDEKASDRTASFDQTAKQLVGWKELPVHLPSSHSQGRPGQQFGDAILLFSHKDKQVNDDGAWKVKHARLTGTSRSTAADANVTTLSGANGGFEKIIFDTYSNDPASIKFSNLYLSGSESAGSSILVMEPDECQVFSLTQDIKADGIGAVLAMRPRSAGSGDESGKWNVIYLEKNKAESGSSA